MSKLMKNGLLLCLVAAFVLCGTVNLVAGEVASSNDKVSVSFYGQVNRAMSLVNDGDDNYLNHVDNDNSSTRFGFKVKAKGSDTLTAGANLEWEYQQNASNKVTQTGDAVSDGSLDKRKLEVYLDFASIGMFTLGHGSTVSDGTSEVDLSGTTVAGYSDTVAWAAGFEFFDKNANSLSGVTIGDVMSNLDGNSRKDRFRYDSPKFAGFQISASTFEFDTVDNSGANPDTHDPAYDIALRYSAQFGDAVKLAGAVAYSDYPSSDGANAADNQVNGSLSVLFSGFSVTVSAGQKEYSNVAANNADSESTYYGKLGYMADFWSVGTTAFAIDYGKYDEFDHVKDGEASTYAIYIVQNLKNWGTELYTGYRIYTLDNRTTEDFDDIGVFFLGMRVKF
jgi:hypothetical protein